MNKYEKKCFEHFKKLRNHNDCRIRYVICYDNIKVFYYYDDDELFDVNKDIDILRQFLKKCKFDINGWNTTAEIGINNSTETNYSDIILTESLNFEQDLTLKNHNFF